MGGDLMSTSALFAPITALATKLETQPILRAADPDEGHSDFGDWKGAGKRKRDLSDVTRAEAVRRAFDMADLNPLADRVVSLTSEWTAHEKFTVTVADETGNVQEICDQLTSAGIELTRVRSNSYSVGVYFADPDGNSNEVYFEDLAAYRRRPEDGEYPRKLEGVAV